MEECLVCLKRVLIILILVGIPAYTLRLYFQESLFIRGLASVVMSIYIYIILIAVFGRLDKRYVVLSLMFIPTILISEDRFLFDMSISAVYIILFSLLRLASLGFLSLAWFLKSFTYPLYLRMFSLLPFVVIFERKRKLDFFYIFPLFITRYTHIILSFILILLYFKRKELFRISVPSVYSRIILFSLPIVSLIENIWFIIFVQFTVCLLLLDILYVSISEYVRKRIGYSSRIDTRLQDIIGVFGYFIFLLLILFGLEEYIIFYIFSLFPLLFSAIFYLNKNINELRKFL